MSRIIMLFLLGLFFPVLCFSQTIIIDEAWRKELMRNKVEEVEIWRINKLDSSATPYLSENIFLNEKGKVLKANSLKSDGSIKFQHLAYYNSEDRFEKIIEIDMSSDDTILVKKFKYDDLGRVIQYKVFQRGGVRTEKFSYDINGNLISISNGLGTKFKIYYNESNKYSYSKYCLSLSPTEMADTVIYNDKGQRFEYIDYMKSKSGYLRERYLYNEQGMCTEVKAYNKGVLEAIYYYKYKFFN